MRVYNISQNTLLAENALLADSFLTRMRGLLGRASLPAGEGLIITGSQSIHMMFMRFPIDVIFIDGSKRVVGLVEHIKPFQFSPVFWKSVSAIELPVDAIKNSRTRLGDQLAY